MRHEDLRVRVRVVINPILPEVFIYLERSQRPEELQLAIETLERTSLLDQANKPAGSLGLLNRKRLEVARALATKPKVLLLDEVAGGLTDPEVLELVDLVRGINAEGLAVVWIEHVMRALTETVDRMTCLAGGKFIADGTPQEVFEDPLVREVYLGHTVSEDGAL